MLFVIGLIVVCAVTLGVYVFQYEYKKNKFIKCVETLSRLGGIRMINDILPLINNYGNDSVSSFFTEWREHPSGIHFNSSYRTLYQLNKFTKRVLQHEKFFFIYFDMQRGWSIETYTVGDSKTFNEFLISAYESMMDKNSVDSDYKKVLQLWRDENNHLFASKDNFELKHKNSIESFNKDRNEYRKQMLGKVQQPSVIKKD